MQVKGTSEWNGALLYVCFALPVGKGSCHMLRFAFYGFALLVGRELSHVTVCFDLSVGEGSCHTLRFALFCFALFCLARARGKLPHVTICFALLCFASLCIALLSFALHCCFVE